MTYPIARIVAFYGGTVLSPFLPPTSLSLSTSHSITLFLSLFSSLFLFSSLILSFLVTTTVKAFLFLLLFVFRLRSRFPHPHLQRVYTEHIYPLVREITGVVRDVTLHVVCGWAKFSQSAAGAISVAEGSNERASERTNKRTNERTNERVGKRARKKDFHCEHSQWTGWNRMPQQEEK